MSYFSFYNPKFQAFDSVGDPLAGGKLYFYVSGSDSTAKTVYQTSTGTPHEQPVTLDSRGEATIYGSGNYKVVLKDADSRVIWTIDPVEIQTYTETGKDLLNSANAGEARTALGLGTAALEDVGTSAENVVQLVAGTDPAQLPAVDGRNLDLTNVPENKFPTGLFGWPPGYISGFKLSYSDTNTLTIGAGSCRDSTNTYNITLAASMNKDLDALWAEGTGQGGAEADTTPLPQLSEWYFVFAIYDATNDAVDVLFSQSATSPTLTLCQAGDLDYTYFRRIGCIRTDGSGNLMEFTQFGDTFIWKVAQVGIQNQAVPDSAKTTIVIDYVPVGFSVEALLLVSVNAAGGTPAAARLFDYGTTAAAPTFGSGTYTLAAPGTDTFEDSITGICHSMSVFTDTAATVEGWGRTSDTFMAILVRGWIDPRGKDD
jgi:hypothetical protein